MGTALKSFWDALDPARQTIAHAYQGAYSAWARRRYKEDFNRVARFCLFVGYPRSGHSVVGALLNAHRDVVIAHELTAHELILKGCTRDELFSRIIASASWFNLIGNRGTYPYQIPNQWQGRFEKLRVIGDKRGGGLTRLITAHPDFLSRVRSLVIVPLRLVHVVRNPFDNISAMAIWNETSLADAVERYFILCQTTAKLGDLCDPCEIITIHHEEMLRAPRENLGKLCAFLELDDYPGYLDDCCRIVFSKPTYTRRKLHWPLAVVRDVERRIQSYRFLDGYQFEIADDHPAVADPPS